MLILTIRTDKPEAEIGLFDDHRKLAYLSYEAHRKLAETIHKQIRDLLTKQNKSWSELEGVVCYQGPGSFTGLRIGLTLANTLAYSLNIPITGSTNDNWLKMGIEKLLVHKNQKLVLPRYGAEPHITTPKK